jgi:REP element-mobilizing transposase RayT
MTFFPLLDSAPSRQRHARVHFDGVPYHIISKTLRGEFLLVPKKHTASMTAGVVAKAQANWPGVRLYGYAFMSNHFHLMVSGESEEISFFVGFIKREISRRLGLKYNLSGSLWHSRFLSTALPTPESQEQCLAYILSQGVKENLVEHPSQWPGLHCAKALLHGAVDEGSWFNGTEYGKAKRDQERSVHRGVVRKSEFYQTLLIKLTPIGAWSHLDEVAQRQRAREVVGEIVAEAAAKRREAGIRVMGRKAVVRMSIFKRVPPSPPPWWEKRRRQITAWARMRDALTQEYLALYWRFQEAFRAASDCLKAGGEASFPKGAWVPAHFR